MEKKRCHWLNWEKICFPTEEDGLGRRQLVISLSPSVINCGGSFMKTSHCGPITCMLDNAKMITLQVCPFWTMLQMFGKESMLVKMKSSHS